MFKATQPGAALTALFHSAAPASALRERSSDVVDQVRTQVLETDPEFRLFAGESARTTHLFYSSATGGLYNYLFAAEEDPREPDLIFQHLRWGGQFIYAARSGRRVAALAQHFAGRGYELVTPPAFLSQPWMGLNLPLLSRKVHYFIARKIALTLPREISERFTYQVQLTRDCPVDAPGGRYVVLKEVPSIERVAARLRHKFPDAPEELVLKRSRKFTEKIFPLFLTREAAMLKILEKNLPGSYVHRVPRVLHLEQDSRGYVRRLWMTWLRAAAPEHKPLPQLEFARQAADMLRVVHDHVGIIHLDLRLDNIVITNQGVGFVDFGSAVREGENIHGNPLLSTLFEELMRTSQIQRMLEKMMSDGSVTSHVLNSAHGRVDKGVDLFYLALQINNPLSNPDFRGLVCLDSGSDEALGLAEITQDVLKPRDPTNPPIRSANDLLRSIERLSFALHRSALRVGSY